MPCDADELARVVERLAAGGLVAFPTETVWGIAADARQPAAVDRLRRFKGRDPAQPISVLVADPAELEPLGCEVGAPAHALIEGCWPGPVTLVLPVAGATPTTAARIANDGGGLGIRCSPHPVAGQLARAVADAGIGPVTATSCNACGDPAAESRAQAREVCTGGADAPLLIETGEDASGGAASTVLDLCVSPARILREGAVGAAALRDILEKIDEPAPLDATTGGA